MQLDKPNLILPLATSYNERGVDGYAATITSGLDQRKINSIYQIVQNAITGKTTPYLAKRPGVAQYIDFSSLTMDSMALSVPVPYDVSTGNAAWIIYANGNIIAATAESPKTANTVLNAASHWVRYIDKTLISGVETVVLQIMTITTRKIRAFYASVSDITTWTEISDADFTGLTHRGKIEHLDGFAFQLDSTNKIYNSDLNSLSSWVATNYTTKQITQDSPMGLAKCGNLLLAFGMNSVEVFHNAGHATGSPLEPVAQMAENIGLVTGEPNTLSASQRHYYTRVGKHLFFVGRVPSGSDASVGTSQGVYRFDGSQFSKISTSSIDKLLTHHGVFSVNTISVSGQLAVALDLVGLSDTAQKWLLYFPMINDWFEWTSAKFQPVGNGYSFLGIGAGTTKNKTYRFSPGSDIWQDAGTDYTMTHQFRLPKDGNQRKRVYWIGLSADTARSAATVGVELSRDDDQNFETLRAIDITVAKKHIYRCGSYQGDLTVRLTGTGNFEYRMENLLARID